MVRCMLYSSSLGAEFWADALVYAAYLYNRTQHASIGMTPYEAWTSRPPDLSHIRTFGTPITVRRPGKRPTKLDPHASHGLFLRFAGTTKNVVYYDVRTRQTKVATHKAHDEFHYGTPHADRSRASKHLLTISSDQPASVELQGQPMMEATIPATYETPEPQVPRKEHPPQLTTPNLVSLDLPTLPTPAAAAVAHTDVETPPTATWDQRQPAHTVPTVRSSQTITEDVLNLEMSIDIFGPSIPIELDITGSHPTLGFRFHGEHRTPTIRECLKGTPAGRVKNWRSRLRHNTIRGVNGEYTLTKDEFIAAIRTLRSAGHQTCTLTIACEEISHPHSGSGVPQLYFDQLHAIAHHLHVLRYGQDHDLWGPNANPVLSDETIHQTVAEGVTPVRLTRRYLLKRDDWPKWEAAEFKQLDSYRLQHMFGDPIPTPSGKPTVLPFVWTYILKHDGRHKARGTCNGGKRFGKAVTLAYTYASCVEQPASRLFWALASLHGMTVLGADAGNAFAEAPPPVEPFYMAIDRQFHNWWTKHLKRPPIPRGHVLPVKHALQGHPESPRLWEQHISQILTELGFKNTTHERCIYRATIDDQPVLFLRQVDDFAVACRRPEIAKDIIAKIGARLTVPLNQLGTIDKFNGIDVHQARRYIKISNESYLNKVLDHHGWQEKTTQVNPIPMRDDSAYQAMLETAKPPETPAERQLLQDEFFNYRQGIGEAIYAMVTCRPDISFAVIKLSQYSNNPAKIHYQALRHLFKYLALTKDRGIQYWRRILVEALPDTPPEVCISRSEILAKIPETIDPDIVFAFVDSDWGSDRTHRRSVTGYILLLAGAVIAYKSKYQQTIALSSTEAEFTAAAEAGKTILYIRSIMTELGFPQEDPTVMYEDNAGALFMANAQQPTRRTRHMDTKMFALQDWVANLDIFLREIGTAYNPSDSFTKALGRIKFYEQTDVSMGRRRPPYVPTDGYAHLAAASIDPQEIVQLLPACILDWLDSTESSYS